MYQALIRFMGFSAFIQNDNTKRTFDYRVQGGPRNPDWHQEQPANQMSDEAAEDFARDYIGTTLSKRE